MITDVTLVLDAIQNAIVVPFSLVSQSQEIMSTSAKRLCCQTVGNPS